nr:MAG TPA: cAMP-dependent protein kinase type I [Bacteriophage sp.]
MHHLLVSSYNILKDLLCLPEDPIEFHPKHS